MRGTAHGTAKVVAVGKLLSRTEAAGIEVVVPIRTRVSEAVAAAKVVSEVLGPDVSALGLLELEGLRGVVHVGARNLAGRSIVRGDGAAGKTAHATLPVRAHDLAVNAAAMGGVADSRKKGTDGIDHASLGLGIGVVHGGLNDVVGERITQHLLQLVHVQHLLDQHPLDLGIGSAKTLLDDVGAELLLGQRRNVTAEALADRVCKGGLGQIKDVLDHIVAKGVFHKRESIASDLSNELATLQAGRMIDTALEDAAAMTMGTDSNAVISHSIKDELGILSRETVQALLDDVIAVEILDKVDNLILESIDDSVDLDNISMRLIPAAKSTYLLGSRDVLDHFLQSTGAVLIESYLDHLRSRIVDKDGTLLVVRIFKELLAQIVAEGI